MGSLNLTDLLDAAIQAWERDSRANLEIDAHLRPHTRARLIAAIVTAIELDKPKKGHVRG